MKTICADGFFEKSRMLLNKWMFLMYLWSMDVGVCRQKL